MFKLLLLLLLVFLHQTVSQSTAYLSSEFGDDLSSDCSLCNPYSFEIILLPGEYTTEISTFFSVRVKSSFSISGQSEYTNCTDGSVTQFDKLPAMIGSWNFQDIGSPNVITIQSIRWVRPERGRPKLTTSSPSLILRNVKLASILTLYSVIIEPQSEIPNYNVSIHTTHGNASMHIHYKPDHSSNNSSSADANFSTIPQMNVLVQNSHVGEGLGLTQSAAHGLVRWNVTLKESTFAKNYGIVGYSLTSDSLTVASFVIERCQFAGKVLLASGTTQIIESPPIYISNSTFDEYSNIFVGGEHYEFLEGDFNVGYNVTLRGNYFAPRNTSLVTAIEVFPRSSPLVWADARGNFWGDRRGPRSCCNPDTNGSPIIWADAAPWCLDELCSELSAPLGNDSLYGVGFSPSWCHYDQICTEVTSTIQFALLGTIATLILVASIATVGYLMHLKRASDPGYLLPQKSIPERRHNVVFVLNACSTAIALIVISVVFIPIVTVSDTVLLATIAVLTWAKPASAFLTGVCILRVASNVWTTIIIRKFSSTYRTLLGNIVWSSVVVFLSIMWRFSSWALSPTVEWPGYEDMVFRSQYYWIITVVFAVSELCFSLPSIIICLGIIKQRDYAEVEGFKQSLQSNPLGSLQDLLQTRRLLRVATAGFWICIVLLVLYIAAVPITLVVLLPPPQKFLSNDELLGISLAAHFAACAIAVTLGAFYFKRRSYDPTYGTAFFALALATIGMMLEVVVYTAIAKQKLINRYSADISVMAAAIVTMLVPTALAGWIIIRLRRDLASDVARSVYQRFESALAE